MSTVISMMVGSKLSTKELVLQSIYSLTSNIGTDDFLLVVGVASHIKSEVVKCIENIALVSNGHVKIVTDHCATFAEFTNHVFLKYAPGSKWFLISHDDIQLKTKNLIGEVEKSIYPFSDKVGWITFTDIDYLNGHWAPSVCGGFHDDYVYGEAWQKRRLHQFHTLKDKYWERGEGRQYFLSLPYDFPQAPVRCHGPMSHLFMMETEKLKQVGLCEDWSVVSLLIDEDWALEALKVDLWNIWIPYIKYVHCRAENGTRAWYTLSSKCSSGQVVAREVADLWEEKWGYRFAPLNKPGTNREQIRRIRQLYGKTNITWSMGRNSFDWEYLKCDFLLS